MSDKQQTQSEYDQSQTGFTQSAQDCARIAEIEKMKVAIEWSKRLNSCATKLQKATEALEWIASGEVFGEEAINTAKWALKDIQDK